MNEMLRKTREWLNCSTRRSFSAVLHEAKITPRQNKAAGYLNNPIASVAAQAMGINLDKMRQDINSLRGATGAAFNALPPQQQQQASSLDAQMDALRKGLQQLK